MSNLPNDGYEAMLVTEFDKELRYYSSVFHDRIKTAFNHLESEAMAIGNAAYDRKAKSAQWETDDSGIAEDAYYEGVAFYLATDSIRQGVFKLMIAGLFHLFEQQAAHFCRPPSKFAVAKPGRSPVEDLKCSLLAAGIKVERFKSWPMVDDLRLLANTVKHGDGQSEVELRKRKPALFRTKFDALDGGMGPLYTNLRPMLGEGLELNDGHFTAYADALTAFWLEI